MDKVINSLTSVKSTDGRVDHDDDHDNDTTTTTDR